MVGFVGMVGKVGRRLRLMYAAWKVWWPWWLNIALMVIAIGVLAGCRTREISEAVNHTSVQIQRDTVRLWHRDSIKVVDSVAVYVHDKGDTVWVTTTRWRYRDRVTVDTVYKARTDTVWRVDSVRVREKETRADTGFRGLARKAGLIGAVGVVGIVLLMAGLVVRIIRVKL